MAELVADLDKQVFEGVKTSFVAETVRWQGLLHQDSWMVIRDSMVFVSIQDGREKGLRKPLCRIVVKSRQVKRQSEFRRRADGSFNIANVVSEVTRRFHLEMLGQTSGSDKQRKILQARQDAKRLAGHYNLSYPRPMGTEVLGPVSVAAKVSKETPGTLRLEFDSLRAKEAQQLLMAAKKLKLLPGAKRPSEGCRTAWEHLQDE